MSHELHNIALVHEQADIPGELLVTFRIEGCDVRAIEYTYLLPDRTLNSYKVDYQDTQIPKTGFRTLNYDLAFSEFGSSREDYWENSAKYYLDNSVRPSLRLDKGQVTGWDYGYAGPLSKAIRYLTENVDIITSLPDNAQGSVRFGLTGFDRDKLGWADALTITQREPIG